MAVPKAIKSERPKGAEFSGVRARFPPAFPVEEAFATAASVAVRSGKKNKIGILELALGTFT